MKRMSFICLFLSVFYVAIAQQESDYMFIKDGLKWVEDYKLEQGSTYTGYLNNANQPTCYGTYTDKSGKQMIGQFQNGKVNGIATFISKDYTYFGETKNDACNGIGRQTIVQRENYSTYQQHVVSLFQGNKSYGVVCTTKGGAVINGEKKEESLDYFPRVIYDEKLEAVKTVCAENNVRYTESTTIGSFTYSGGWKNGQPYLYGAFQSRNRSRAIYGIGYIEYDSNKQEVDVDYSKPFERWYEDYYKCIYRKLDINNDGDTTRIYQSADVYEYSVIGKDGKYKRNDVFHFGSTDDFTKFYKYVNGHPWGIFGKNRYIQEGYLDTETGHEPEEGKLLTEKGELHKFSKGQYEIYFPNGDKMLVHEQNRRSGCMLATYTSKSGDYAIGWFRQESYGNSDKDFYKYVEPIFARAYFSDGEFKKEIVYSYASNYIGQPEKEMVILLIEAPKNGTAEYTFADGRVYKGEWKNHLMDGLGTMTYKDGNIEQGTFVRGSFVKGTMVKEDGTKKWGEMSNGNWRVDSVLYTNGTYEKYVIENGKKVTYIKSYYRTSEMSYNDAVYIGAAVKQNTYYPPLTVKVYEQTDEASEANYIYEGTQQTANSETVGEGIFTTPSGNYLGGTFKMSEYGRKHYIICTDLTSFKGSYSKGVYEGGIEKSGKPVQGKYISENGIVFEGQFISTSAKNIVQANGDGMLTMVDGTVVKAAFGENYTYNEARITYANGDSYDGAMVKGVREGKGEYVFSNGDKVSSTWSKNALDQETIYIWADGRKFVGNSKGNKPAKGIFYAADGNEVDKKEAKSWTFEVPSAIVITTPK